MMSVIYLGDLRRPNSINGTKVSTWYIILAVSYLQFTKFTNIFFLQYFTDKHNFTNLSYIYIGNLAYL